LIWTFSAASAESAWSEEGEEEEGLSIFSSRTVDVSLASDSRGEATSSCSSEEQSRDGVSVNVPSAAEARRTSLRAEFKRRAVAGRESED
jgi:hypothetical protein